MKKHRNIYLFLYLLAIIGLITGIKYYEIQNSTTKEEIKNQINIKEELSKRTNIILKESKDILKTYLCGLTIIPQIFNIIDVFYEPFKLGFISKYLLQYNAKFTFYYTLFYQLIPLIFYIILIRISISISKSIISWLIYRNTQYKNKIIQLSLKYFIISLILFLYSIILFIFSININEYLLSLLN